MIHYRRIVILLLRLGLRVTEHLKEHEEIFNSVGPGSVQSVERLMGVHVANEIRIFKGKLAEKIRPSNRNSAGSTKRWPCVKKSHANAPQPGLSLATMNDNVIRILLCKVGLDGHDRGVKVVARILRDAGMDVIYGGIHKTPEQVVTAAIQEDVDILGISLLSGAHLPLFSRVTQLLKEKKADDIILICGGLTPDEDVPKLKKMGVAEILRQDATPEQIVSVLRRLVAKRGDR